MPATPGGIKAGRAFILIEAVDRTGQVLGNVRNVLLRFGSEMSQIGRTMALRAATALLPVGLAVKTGVAFDDIIRKVGARGEGTAADLKMLSDQAKELGTQSSFTAIHIARMMDMLAQLGFKPGQISQMIEPVMALASSGVEEGVDQMQAAAISAKAIGGTLKAFNMDIGQTAEVADKLAIALNQSNYTLEELTTSLSYAGPAANFYKVSLDETIAVLAAMRDLNIDASIAGTAFRNMLGYMSQGKEQDKFNEALLKATGNTVDFKKAINELHSPAALLIAILKATETMTLADRSQILTDLLETRATIPAAAVGNSAAAMGAMMDRLKVFNGYSKQVQDQMNAGLGGAFRRLWGIITNLAIAIGDALTPALQSTSKWLQVAGLAITKWVSRNAGLITTLVAATAGFVALGVALVVAGQAVIALSALFSAAGALTALLSVGLLAAPWVAAAAGIYLANDAINELTGTTSGFGDQMNRIGSDVGSVFTEVANSIGELATSIQQQWSDSFGGISQAMARGDIQNAVEIMCAQIKVTFQEMFNAISDMRDDFIEGWLVTKVSSTSVWTKMNQGALDFFEHVAPESNAPWYNKTPLQWLVDSQREKWRESQAAMAGTESGMLAEAFNDPEIAARRGSRAERLSKFRTELDAAKVANAAAESQTLFDQAAANLDGFDTAVVTAAESLGKLQGGAASLIGLGQIPMRGAPDALMAVEKGTIDELKSIAEDRSNTEELLLELQKSAVDFLEQIKNNTAQQPAGM